MLQAQYYNKGLTKKQIDSVLNNYKIKYCTIKNEIELKINYMIKQFLNDINEFLINIEEIAEQSEKIKNYDRNNLEIILLRKKLDEKTISEIKLKNENEKLKKENRLLRDNSNKTTRSKSPLKTISNNKTNKKKNKPKLNDSQIISNQEKNVNLIKNKNNKINLTAEKEINNNKTNINKLNNKNYLNLKNNNLFSPPKIKSHITKFSNDIESETSNKTLLNNSNSLIKNSNKLRNKKTSCKKLNFNLSDSKCKIKTLCITSRDTTKEDIIFVNKKDTVINNPSKVSYNTINVEKDITNNVNNDYNFISSILSNEIYELESEKENLNSIIDRLKEMQTKTN